MKTISLESFVVEASGVPWKESGTVRMRGPCAPERDVEQVVKGGKGLGV